MDALLATFLAVLLGEIGERGQLSVILLTLRFPGRERAVLAAVVASACGIAAIGAGAGALLHGTIPFRATTLLVALALIATGAGALARPTTPKLRVSPRLGAFGASLAALLAAGIGGGAQFLIFALAARSPAPVLAAAGGVLAIVAAAVPALLLGRRMVQVLPIRRLRIGVATVLLPLGLWFGLDALRLV